MKWRGGETCRLEPTSQQPAETMFCNTLSLFLRGLCLLGVLFAFPVFGQQRDVLVLGTATAGGGFEVYGEAVVKTIALADPLLVIDARNTAGSTENISLIETGAVDMALIQGEAAYEAFIARAGKDSNLRIVAAMYPTAGMFVVRADSPYQSIDDLKGHAVAFGAKSSGLVTLARYVLDGIGLDMERDFIPILLDRAGDGPALLRNGKVAALWGGGSGWPVFTAVMAAPGGGRFIAPSHEQIARIRTRFPFLQEQTLPPDTYSGQTAAIKSVGSWSFIMARRTLPDDVVYRFCRALFIDEEKLSARYILVRETTMKNTVAALPRRELLHPGALRYLEEHGVLR